MNKNLWVVVVLVFGMGIFSYTGCKKTDSPMGIYAPNGLDVPSPTFTPLAGTINVYVVDAETNTGFATNVSGVTVRLTDPNSEPYTQVTGNAPFDYAAFNFLPIKTGAWTAEVLTQATTVTSFYDSTQPFTVTGTGQATVTFTAEAGSLTVSPVSIQYFYGSGYSYPVTLTYIQSGNLSVPVSVCETNILPPGFNAPQSVVLGEGVNSSVVTITQGICYDQSVIVSFTGFDFLGNKIFTPTVSMSKGYSYACACCTVIDTLSIMPVGVSGPITANGAFFDYTKNTNVSFSFVAPASYTGSFLDNAHDTIGFAVTFSAGPVSFNYQVDGFSSGGQANPWFNSGEASF
ncbi:MAG TPA: hypothetical protein VJ873_14245 [bacterium]|nr:hypothetical protein [bacterium]